MFSNGLRDGWLDKQKYDNDKELFYRSGTLVIMNLYDEHYNSLQAKYIKCIANHEMINQGENGIKNSKTFQDNFV